jgi:hypothetical protein
MEGELKKWIMVRQIKEGQHGSANNRPITEIQKIVIPGKMTYFVKWLLVMSEFNGTGFRSGTTLEYLVC